MDTEAEHKPQQQDPGPALFFCHLCQSEYRQPKLLTCLHSFCMSCLSDAVIEDTSHDLVICPLCTHGTLLPAEGLVGLTDNSFLQRVSTEYITGVKSNIVAKSLSPQAAKKLGPHEAYIATSGMRRRFSEEMAHLKMANLTDEQKTVSSRNLKYKSDAPSADAPIGYSEFRRASVDRGEYTATAMDALNNMSRLQGKLMSLQGEALRVTYAIDRINQHMTSWHQHKEDLKQEVQRRSIQFQAAAKKMERQILSEIESKGMEDQFYAELDKGKTDLRRNLKNILHEISVIKSVHELGKYSEINDLSSSLLGPSVVVSEVVLDMLSYQLDIPTKPIEEMVSVGFGNLITTQEKSKVFKPELRDFNNVPLDQLTSDYETSQGIKTQVKEGTEVLSSEQSRGRSSMSRRKLAAASGSKRYTSDLGLGRSNVQEHLEQFQNARESFRTRRQEILRQGQVAREDQSPLRGDGRKLPWPTYLLGRVQSLDRSSNPEERSKVSVRNLSAAKGEVVSSYTRDGQRWGEESFTQDESDESRRPEDLTMPSPIIEEGSNPSSPKKGFDRDERVPARFMPQIPSPGGTIYAQNTFHPDERRRTTSLGSSSRQSSLDETPPLSPTAEGADLRVRATETSRPLRKAFISATDKRSKIEFLRENWQKRKELLIQSHGFVTSETATSTGKQKSDVKVTSPGNIPTMQRRTSDSGIKDFGSISERAVGVHFQPLPTQLTAATLRQQGQSILKTSPATSLSATGTSSSSSTTLDTEGNSLTTKGSHEKDGDHNEEEEVTSTTTIPITGQLYKNMLAKPEDVQIEQKGKEDEEEMTVTTETFSIDQNLITNSARTDHSRDTSDSGKVHSQIRTDSSTTTVSIGPKTTRPASVEATTVTPSNTLTLQTSIITGTTLTAPPQVHSKTSPYTPSSIISPVSTTRTSTTTTIQQIGSQPPPSSTGRTISAPSSQPATTLITTSSSQTSAATATAISPTSSTSGTSDLGRYNRRYVTRTETIDVAALLANMYKPSSPSSPSSSSKSNDTKRDDEEKENLKNENEIPVKSQSDSQSIIGTDRVVTKSTFSPNNSLNTERTLTSNKAPSIDSSQTKSSDVAVFKITGNAFTQKAIDPAAISSSEQRVLSHGQSGTFTSPGDKVKETDASPEIPDKTGTGNIIESARQSVTILPPGSPRDQKVKETFSQAESSRKRYNPASSRSSARSSSRRHTVEISKTIPEGMRLSDMYKPHANESEVMDLSGNSDKGKSDLQKTVIVETQDEYAKDPTTRETETLTFRTGPSSSFTEFPSSSLTWRSRTPPNVGLRVQVQVPESDTTTTTNLSSPTPVTTMTSHSSATTDPASGQDSAGVAHGKLRDIARRKKERWRRLTIT